MDRRNPRARAGKAARPRRHRIHFRRDKAETLADGLVPLALRTGAHGAREGARADRSDQGGDQAARAPDRVADQARALGPLLPPPRAHAPAREYRGVVKLVVFTTAAEKTLDEVQH